MSDQENPFKLTAEELLTSKSGKYLVKKGYYETLVNGKDSPGKREIRDKVVDLVLSTCEWSKRKPLRFLSLPGPRWVVEHELFRQTKQQARFTAFENNDSLLLKGAVNVPRSQYPQGHGHRKLNVLDVRYFKTNSARWMNVDFMDWCMTTSSSFGFISQPHMLPLGERPDALYQNWLDRYWSFDAAWLDFTSCLSSRMALALCEFAKLSGYPDRGVDKPIVISVLKGREPKDITKILKSMTRTEYITFLLDRRPGYKLEVIESFEYNTTNTNPMLNVIAVWRKKT